jgi:hypothetical protein
VERINRLINSVKEMLIVNTEDRGQTSHKGPGCKGTLNQKEHCTMPMKNRVKEQVNIMVVKV